MTTTTTDCSNKQPTAYAQLAIPLSTFGVSQDKAAATTTPETTSLLTENNSGSQNNVSGQQPNINQNHHHHHYDPNEWVTEDTAARDRLIRALRYNFMSPKDRSMITHRFPGKLVLQIFKILVVSYQLYHFGSDVEQYKAADSSMEVSLHNLFMLNWESRGDDSPSYAVYTKKDVYEHIDHALHTFANISAMTIGAFGYQIKGEKEEEEEGKGGGGGGGNALEKSYFSNRSADSFFFSSSSSSSAEMSTPSVCYTQYRNATLSPSRSAYHIDPDHVNWCLEIKPTPESDYAPGSPTWAAFSYLHYLKTEAQSQQQQKLPNINLDPENFESLLHMQLKLPLRTILLNTIVAFNTPQCFDLDVAINFDNRQLSGEITIALENDNHQIACYGNLEDRFHKSFWQRAYEATNVLVPLLCTLSLALCIRSLWRTRVDFARTVCFFAHHYHGRPLEFTSMLHFINGWVVMIFADNCLLFSGSLLNLLTLFDLLGSHRFNLRPVDYDSLISALLGVGNLLLWFGLLRYLTFFTQYNVLIVTLKHALARVIRFLFCVLILYGGFCYSGWIILGSSHAKFRSLGRTSEALFALMNGDEVFTTFDGLQTSSSRFVWWFSRLYLYSFVMLFIFVILSLFIAMLTDSYETIKDYYKNRKQRLKGSLMFSNDQLARFIASSPVDVYSGNWYDWFRRQLLEDAKEEKKLRKKGGKGGNRISYLCALKHITVHLASKFRWLKDLVAAVFD